VGMVTAVTSVAVALFFIGVVLCFIAKYGLQKIDEIWDDFGGFLHHELLMRRAEVRLMIDDAGYEIPDWMLDDKDDDEVPVQAIRLVPKQDSTE